MKKNKNKKSLLFGLLNKKERLGLSWKGRLIGILISICLFIFSLKTIYPFLAPTNRLDSKILVVEGWLLDEDMKESVEEFKTYNYDHIYVTGGPIQAGAFLSEYKSYAQLGTETLKKIGINPKQVTAVPGPETIKDRTFTSALALKKYFENERISSKSLNLFSHGPHAKRSQLLFELAFENKVKIGIIASKSPFFNSEKWWTSSAGVRTLVDELIAYPYAVFFKYTHLGSL